MGWFNRKAPASDLSKTSGTSHPQEVTGHGEKILHLSLYRLGEYADNLRTVRARYKGLLPGVVTIGVTPSGKYTGQPFATISVDGLSIGELPAQHRAKNAQGYNAVFDRDLTTVDVIIFVYSGEVPSAFLRLSASK